MSFVILPIFVLVFVYLVYMPQQKQKKAQAALLASLDEGDSVLTSGGIYGVIAEVDGDSVYLEVAPGIELRVSKSAVLRKIVEATEPSSESK
jgi:preprotein translocase subunit YajC